ncbi:MAG: hypothetical protein R3B57_09160 [Phycisphaerales bacterium]
MTQSPPTAVLFAGIPAHNFALYHQIRFQAGDPAALVVLGDNGSRRRRLIIRDIEMDRARAKAKADEVASPSDFTPAGGLSGDRETATAQAAAEMLRREGVARVVSDRTLPLSYAHEIEAAGIELVYDPDLGVRERRAKDTQELAWLREAQHVTEQCVKMACETIAHADAASDGQLMKDGKPLTADRVRTMIDVWLLERGHLNELCIVVSGPQGGDCHRARPPLQDRGHRRYLPRKQADFTTATAPAPSHGQGAGRPQHACGGGRGQRDAIAQLCRRSWARRSIATVAALARHGYRFAAPPRSPPTTRPRWSTARGTASASASTSPPARHGWVAPGRGRPDHRARSTIALAAFGSRTWSPSPLRASRTSTRSPRASTGAEPIPRQDGEAWGATRWRTGESPARIFHARGACATMLPRRGRDVAATPPATGRYTPLRTTDPRTPRGDRR